MTGELLSIIGQGSVIGIIGAFVGAKRIVEKYGEFWRPLGGIILLKKPKMSLRHDTQSLFAASNLNNGKRKVTNMTELRSSYRHMQAFIQKNSWFKLYDLDILAQHYLELRRAIEKRDREDARRREESMWKQTHKGTNQSKPKTKQYVAGWRQILNVEASCNDAKVIKNNYRRLVSKDHPDKGGKGTKMADYNKALESARQELNFV